MDHLEQVPSIILHTDYFWAEDKTNEEIILNVLNRTGMAKYLFNENDFVFLYEDCYIHNEENDNQTSC